MYSRDTDSLAFYGSTATLGLLTSVAVSDNPRPNKKQKRSGPQSEATSDNSDSTFQDQIYATGDSYRTSTSAVQEAIASAHFEYFLRVVSDVLPVLEPNILRVAYERFWLSPQSRPGSPLTRQEQCLIYSVLALGAVHSNTSEKDAEWAFDYFAEAQGLIGTLFSTNSLETVQAAMLMVIILVRRTYYLILTSKQAIYSHHTAQPTCMFTEVHAEFLES